MTARVFHARLFHTFRENGNFWYQICSQGSVATYEHMQGVMGDFNDHVIANFLANLSVKKIKIGWGLSELLPWVWSLLFWYTVYLSPTAWQLFGLSRWRQSHNVLNIFRWAFGISIQSDKRTENKLCCELTGNVENRLHHNNSDFSTTVLAQSLGS